MKFALRHRRLVCTSLGMACVTVLLASPSRTASAQPSKAAPRALRIPVKPEPQVKVIQVQRVPAVQPPLVPFFDKSIFNTPEMPVEETLEFQLSFPLFKANARNQDYTKLQFAVLCETNASRPDPGPLVHQARQLTNPRHQAKGLLVVAGALMGMGDFTKGTALVDEALAIAVDGARDRKDIEAQARSVVDSTGNEELIKKFAEDYPALRERRSSSPRDSAEAPDAGWRESVLQLAELGAHHPIYESYAAYDEWREKNRYRSLRPPRYYGTNLLAPAEPKPIAEHFALLYMNREYLPDDRLEAFRSLFRNPNERPIIYGWSGGVQQINPEPDTDTYLVRVALNPHFQYGGGGIWFTDKRFLETWRFDPATEQLTYLGGHAYGSGAVFLD